MEDLRGRVVLVTGAARGMGKLHAENFCSEGAIVVATDVDEAELNKTVDELKSRGYEAYAYLLDVSDREACMALAEQLKTDVGAVDVLINNAGITDCQAVLDMAEASARRMMAVNFFGQLWMMQAFVPDMIKRGSGHILNMCSVAGKSAIANMGGYCATKFAMIGLTDAIRMELSGTGVHFSIVNPGFVKTGMFEGAKVPFITSWQKPETVSAAVLRAVKKNQAEVCVPRFNVRLVAFVRGLCMPKMMDFTFKMFGLDKAMKSWQKDTCRPF